jgi:hypothetical protein
MRSSDRSKLQCAFVSPWFTPCSYQPWPTICTARNGLLARAKLLEHIAKAHPLLPRCQFPHAPPDAMLSALVEVHSPLPAVHPRPGSTWACYVHLCCHACLYGAAVEAVTRGPLSFYLGPWLVNAVYLRANNPIPCACGTRLYWYWCSLAGAPPPPLPPVHWQLLALRHLQICSPLAQQPLPSGSFVTRSNSRFWHIYHPTGCL